MSQKQGVAPGSSAGGKIWLDKVGGLVLGKLIKSGGAGSVYLLPGAPTQVAKLYHPHLDRVQNRRKLEAMLELSPELPDQLENGRRYVQIAWPQAAVFDGEGGFAGFVMPLLDMAQTAELEHILQERQARAAGLPTGLGPKLTLAANLAAVIDALHQQQHYVVDLKPVNLRFYRDSLYIAMLDCDGFSIQGHAERFPAEQFTVDYLAPEFQRKGMPAGAEPAQDRFALAVVIFQLLNFGIHPYSGRPANAQVPTDIPGRIRDGYYAYGVKRQKLMAPNATSGHALMPPELRAMFDRAFGKSPKAVRPSASDWAQLLRTYAQRSGGKLTVCKLKPEHQHFTGMACAACARDTVIAAAANASSQAQLQRIQPPAARQHAPGQAAVPVSAHPGTISGRRWTVAVVLVLLSLFILLGLSIWASSEEEKEQQQKIAQEAGRERLRWQTPKPAGFLQSDASKLLHTLSQDMSRGDEIALTRDLQLLYRTATHNNSGYQGDQVRQQLRTTLMEGLGALPGYQPDLANTYRDQLQSDPRDYLAAAALGRMHLSLNEPQAARQYFEQAVWARPTDGVAWLGLAASALLRGNKDDATHLAALGYLTAQRYAIQNAMPAEDGEAPDNGLERTQRRMDRAGAVLRMAQSGAYPKRWDQALAEGVVLAKKLQALPPLPDQPASVVRDSMQTVDYGPPEPAMAEGQNRLTVSIGASGALTAVQAEQVMEPFLNQVVLLAVKSWTLQPAVQHGQLKDSKVDILLRYRNGRVSFVAAPENKENP
ncbi:MULTISPECIES: hypothetical protein [unclassified Janthinobacterium]|uniref:hypothetical protein n=1 Tax=unclassified Janthinobacterium TaxID=2610881 RepID=UPI00161156AB|nr:MULTISPECIES: hypothetical protein [unclassified Janthinobacterium]MBB5369860.1 tetratricopeptide (TPR) repeat protein [Janthinobacterium sp. K2C7]MBB5382666.1 tetratricopeptide (TPR) repeat protein [Janthinobacterium sp. K2Li3]MBB5384651.1 tetratricopeptide (TPR) repeat protein [Janthinobacterium sp. K2E3]